MVRQVRALQVLETVHVMAGGFPHRMRYRAFNQRYRVIVGRRTSQKNGIEGGAASGDKSYTESKVRKTIFDSDWEKCEIVIERR